MRSGNNIKLTTNFFSKLQVPLATLFDQSLLLDMLFLGAPQLRTGLGFLLFFKVSFMKHPSQHATLESDLDLPNLFAYQKIHLTRGELEQDESVSQLM